MWRKWNSHTAGGHVKCWSPFGKWSGSSSDSSTEIVVIELMTWHSNSSPTYIPKGDGKGMFKHTRAWIFIATSPIRAKKWERPRCPLADEWITKMWHIHAMGYYYSAIKRSEVLRHATTRMDLKTMVLGYQVSVWKDESGSGGGWRWRSHTNVCKATELDAEMVKRANFMLYIFYHNSNKNNYATVKEASHKRPHIVWFHFYKMSRTGQSTDTENSPVAWACKGWGEWGVTADGLGVSFSGDECSRIRWW